MLRGISGDITFVGVGGNVVYSWRGNLDNLDEGYIYEDKKRRKYVVLYLVFSMILDFLLR